MTEERKIQLIAEVDATGTRAGFNEIQRQAGTMADSVQRKSQEAERAVAGIGGGANAAARSVESAQRNLIGSIQRSAAAMEAGAKSGSAYYEVLARQRGVDPAVLEPYLVQLRAIEAAQRQSNATLTASADAQTRAAEAARIEAAAQREAAQARVARESFLASLREQISLYGKSSEEVLRFRAAQAGAADAAGPLILQLQNVRAAHDAVAKAARDEAEAQKKALQVQSGQNSFLSGLEQQALAIGKTRSQLLELQAAQLGVSTKAAPFIAQLRQSEAGLTHVGTSAAQTAAALRGVPAQFTDIITSIQGGQAPFTVLLQQGGQLKDMFGGAGNAAKALGGYAMGMLNPLTVGAAAAVVLGYAYHEGAIEAKAYNRELILSGNAAGSTAGKLSDMARSVSRAIGTQGAAAEALTALVGTGKVSAANLEQFSAVAIKAQRALGQSVSDTATEFADLAKTPVASLEKLNEKYHFLTGAIYEQIKALQNQGRGYDAGVAAQQAYATAFDGVTTKVTANLGAMQRGWVFVKDAAKEGWDAMLNVGRADSLAEQLAKVQASIAKAQKPFEGGVGGNAEDRMSLKANLEKEKSLKNQIALEDTKSALAADQARFNAADLEWSKTKEQYLTRQQQRDMELEAVKNRGLAAGASDKAINEELVKVRKKYADIENLSIDSRIEKLKQLSAVEDVRNRRNLDKIKFQQDSGQITDEQAIERATAAEVTRIDKRRDGLVQELGLIKQKQNSQKDQESKEGEIAVLREDRLTRLKQGEYALILLAEKRAQQSRDLYNAGITSAASELESTREATKAQVERNEQIGFSATELLNLQQRRSETIAGLKEESAAALEAIEPGNALAQTYREQAKEIRSRSAAEKSGFVKERDPWVNLRLSIKRYGDEASNVGAQIGDAMTNAFRSAEDAFVGFVTTGKISFSGLAVSILADIARIQARKAIAGFVDMAVGAFTGSVGGSSGPALAGARAAGGPVTGGLSYLVGEKGPEIFTPSGSGAIIPNNRMGAGGGDINISTNVNVSAGGATSQTTGDQSSAGRALAEMINVKVKEVLVRETRQGGILWNQQMRGAA